MTLFPQAPGAFGLAEEPWMPRLCDILHKRDTEQDERYQNIGLEKCELQPLINDRISARYLLANSGMTLTLPAAKPWTVYCDLAFGTDVSYEFYIGGEWYSILSGRYDKTFDSVAGYPDEGSEFTIHMVNKKGAVLQKSAVAIHYSADSYPHITSHWSAICELFNERYMFRMLGQETLERWQMRLQYRLDQIAPQYERAFALYEKNATEIGNVKQTQTTSSSGKIKTIDTPDSAINDSDDYADRVTKNEGEVTVSMEPEGGLLESLHKNVDEWRNLEDRFVSEFESLFLNTFDY